MIKDYLRKRMLKKQKQAERQNVTEELPDFTNRLVLLLNAGLVLTSAAAKITDEEERDCYFYRELKNINERVMNVNSSFVTEFREFAKRSGVRELLRLSNIITDNINKGADLISKLEQESAFMWHMSKKQVEERGRIAESKLTFPMALMLIALVMITAAPAFMSFK